MGVDVIGFKINNDNKKEGIHIQVKRFEGKVGREYADKFVGALNGAVKENGYSKLLGLFITTGKYPDSFKKKLSDSQDKKISFACWDGEELSRQMLKNGLEVKYSLDLEFWEDIDSTVFLKNKIKYRSQNDIPTEKDCSK